MKKVKFQFAVQIQAVAFSDDERSYLVSDPYGRVLGLSDNISDLGSIIQDLDSQIVKNTAVNADN